MLRQETLLARSYQRELLDPGYAVSSSNPRWCNALHGHFPRSPSDIRLLLDPHNPLRFNLLSYGDTFDDRHDFLIASRNAFQTTLGQAQYHSVTTKGRTGLTQLEVNSFCHILPFIDTGDCESCHGYYLGAVLYSQRASRRELTFVFGSLHSSQDYRTIRIAQLVGDLHFRIQPYHAPSASTKGKYRPCVIDFHLEQQRSVTAANKISCVRIREFRHLRPTYDKARQLCDCRDLCYSNIHRSSDGHRWKVPVDEYRGIFFYEV